ncbi:branched-chain amino acid ABC transporter, permease protein [Peptoanaerobacter stomatis]|uniref:Branched-chain amino acid ABC transporter, permease protein n=1 Tax=Peptoanaerobacter stomatis TaxID=796937 RepID=J6HAI3_9FIRM|nr:branched-chain amino acid ABC transporter permease [Peptoanaerobacter stomatis]EJU19878.1 branched-chain amino acid ABC transporter, permease protein [Peptoanaerobacter stomatis]
MNTFKKKNFIINIFGVTAVFLLVNFLMKIGIITNYLSGIMILVCINMVLAISLNITAGCLGQMALGHAGFMSIGAYTAGLFTKSGLIPGFAGYIVALILGGLVAAIIGLGIGIPALRLKGDYLAILTLAFCEIIRVLIEFFKFTGGAKGLTGIKLYKNFSVIYIIMVLCVFMMYTFMKSRHGRAILSIREDEIASEASGINPTFYKTLAFVYSAFFAGLAGGMYAHYIGILGAKNFDFNKSIDILVIVVLGGLGSFTGSAIGAIVLTVLPELLRGFNDYRMFIYSIILILMMIFRPYGLLGTKEFSLTNLIDRALPNAKLKKGGGANE